MGGTSGRAAIFTRQQRQSEDMSQDAIDTVQEEIAKDIYEIAAFYKEDINRIMQEFDKHDIDTTVQLDQVEAERVSKTPGLGAPETSQPGPSTDQAHHENNTKDDTNTDDDVAELHPRPDEEPSIFDIFDDSDEDQQE